MTDLKQFKKIIAFSVVLIAVLSCTVVLMGAFSADSASRMISASASPMQTDTINDRPRLTWEAIKELANGSTRRSVSADILSDFLLRTLRSFLLLQAPPVRVQSL